MIPEEPSGTSGAGAAGLSFRFGMPHPVTRTIPLPRGLDDRGWQALVEELEKTFGGPGMVESWGESRSWRYGEVEVHLEPVSPPPGARVRIVCHGLEAMVLRITGGILLLVGPGILGLAAIGDDPMTAGWFVVILGAAMILWSWVTLPRWRRRRTALMEEVALGDWSPS